ncbi:hypothetical protein OS493_034605 [Desmophyllum pertusum]|uniref:Uncharacterized protein n=1 Tax=Desmophyllum pertusum TaxID=174260 RepID=A0A9W9ZWE1_9CNID|nr:hypothetical protein OS493_034605 [Desmophyllum pertusum]
MDEGSDNDELGEGREANWSVYIPSARSSQTVRRQEKSLDIEAIKENLLWKSTSDLNGECTRSGDMLPVGVCSKVVARASSELYDHQKLLTAVPSRTSLPHPSKLRKRKRKRSKNINMHTTSHNQHTGFDVTAHVAQLKRKQAEFNWLPANLRNDITSSSSCSVDEEPFPPDSIGPQCVPSTPTLVKESFELQSGNMESWQLPTLDLFNTYHQPVPQLSGHFSIPSYAVARRERPQEELQDEGFHIISFCTMKIMATIKI